MSIFDDIKVNFENKNNSNNNNDIEYKSTKNIKVQNKLNKNIYRK